MHPEKKYYKSFLLRAIDVPQGPLSCQYRFAFRKNSKIKILHTAHLEDGLLIERNPHL
jgi:hypothetical protein